MPIGASQIAGATVGLIPSLFQLFSGNSQIRAANKINPVNPNFQINTGVVDNARILQDRAGNYTMPGYSGAVDQVGGATANAFTKGIQGASSGGDVLDLATKLAYGQQQQINQLAQQNAQGADQALMQSLNANAQAGQQYQDKNAYDRDIYQQRLREKAALIQGGNQNLYGGLDSLATVGTTLLNPRQTVNTGQQLTPEQLAAQSAYLKSLGGI